MHNIHNTLKIVEATYPHYQVQELLLGWNDKMLDWTFDLRFGTLYAAP